jgi:hypothetical protein
MLKYLLVLIMLLGCTSDVPQSLALPEDEAVSDYGCWVDRYPEEPDREETEHWD